MAAMEPMASVTQPMVGNQVAEFQVRSRGTRPREDSLSGSPAQQKGQRPTFSFPALFRLWHCVRGHHPLLRPSTDWNGRIRSRLVSLAPRDENVPRLSMVVKDPDTYFLHQLGSRSFERRCCRRQVSIVLYHVGLFYLRALRATFPAVKKILKPFSTPVLAKRTYRELRLLKHFKHDNIISLYDVFISPLEDIYFVTELLGTDLHRLLTSRPLEKQFVQYFLYQILVGYPSPIAVKFYRPLIYFDLSAASNMCTAQVSFIVIWWVRSRAIYWTSFRPAIDKADASPPCY